MIAKIIVIAGIIFIVGAFLGIIVIPMNISTEKEHLCIERGFDGFEQSGKLFLSPPLEDSCVKYISWNKTTGEYNKEYYPFVESD